MFGKSTKFATTTALRVVINKNTARTSSSIPGLYFPGMTVITQGYSSGSYLAEQFKIKNQHKQHETFQQDKAHDRNKGLTASQLKTVNDARGNSSLKLEVKMPHASLLELKLGDMVSQLQTINYSAFGLKPPFVSQKSYSCLNWNQEILKKLRFDNQTIDRLNILLKKIAKLKENTELQTQRGALEGFLAVMDILAPLIPMHRINVTGRRETLDQIYCDFNELLKVPFLFHKDEIMAALGLASSTNDSTVEQSLPPQSIAVENTTEETTALPPRMPPANTYIDEIDFTQALVPARINVNQEIASWLAGDQFHAILITANGRNVGFYLNQNAMNALFHSLQQNSHSGNTLARVSFVDQQGHYGNGQVNITPDMLMQLFQLHIARQRQARARAAIDNRASDSFELPPHPQVEELDSGSTNSGQTTILEHDGSNDRAEDPREASNYFDWLTTPIRLMGLVARLFALYTVANYASKPMGSRSQSSFNTYSSSDVSLHVNDADINLTQFAAYPSGFYEPFFYSKEEDEQYETDYLAHQSEDIGTDNLSVFYQNQIQNNDDFALNIYLPTSTHSLWDLWSQATTLSPSITQSRYVVNLPIDTMSPLFMVMPAQSAHPLRLASYQNLQMALESNNSPNDELRSVELQKASNTAYCRVSFTINGEESVFYLDQKYLVMCEEFFSHFIQDPNITALTSKPQEIDVTVRYKGLEQRLAIDFVSPSGKNLHWLSISSPKMLQMLGLSPTTLMGQKLKTLANHKNAQASVNKPAISFQSATQSKELTFFYAPFPTTIKILMPTYPSHMLTLPIGDMSDIDDTKQKNNTAETINVGIQTDDIFLKTKELPQQFSQWLNFCINAGSVLGLIALYQLLKQQQANSKYPFSNHQSSQFGESFELDSADEILEALDEEITPEHASKQDVDALKREITNLKIEIARLQKRPPRHLIRHIQDPNQAQMIKRLNDKVSVLTKRLNQQSTTVHLSSNSKSDNNKTLSELQLLRRQLRLAQQQIESFKTKQLPRSTKFNRTALKGKTKETPHREADETSIEELTKPDRHIDLKQSQSKLKPSKDTVASHNTFLEISGDHSASADVSKIAETTAYSIFANINQGRKTADDFIKNSYSRDNLFSPKLETGEEQYLLKINYPKKQALTVEQHQALLNDGLEISSSTGMAYTLIHQKNAEPCAVLKKADAKKELDESEDEHYQRLAMTVMNMIDNVATHSLKMEIKTNDPFVNEIAQQYLAFLNKQDGIHFTPTFNNSCPKDAMKEQAAITCFEKLVTRREADIVSNNPAISEIKAFQANSNIDLTDEEDEDDEVEAGISSFKPSK